MYKLGDNDLTYFKDYHRGELGFVCFNGEHVNDIDFKTIVGYPMFLVDDGYKKINANYNYLVTINQLDSVYGIDHITFSSDGMGTYLLNFNRKIPMFQTNLEKTIYSADSSGYVAIQAAYYMGINPLVLLGVDHATDKELVAFDLAYKAFMDDERGIYNGSSWTDVSYNIIPRISLDIYKE